MAKKKEFDLEAALKAQQSSFLANEALAALNKRGLLVKGEDLDTSRVPYIPTGIPTLDIALGGGVPAGRASQFYGAENSGKTTVMIKTLANAQRLCHNCYRFLDRGDCECPASERRLCTPAVIDIEGTMTAKWMKENGVFTNNIVYTKPSSAEEAAEILDNLLETGTCDLIIFDSVAALVTSNELDRSFLDEKAPPPAAVARLLGSMTKKFAAKNNGAAMETGRKTTLLLSNQIRMKVGIVYGSPETLPGGNSLKYLCDIMLRLTGKIFKDDKTHEMLANETTFSFQKTKFPVLKEGTFRTQLCKVGDKGIGSIDSAATLREMATAFEYFAQPSKGKPWLLTFEGQEPQEFKSKDAFEEWVSHDENETSFVRGFLQTLLKARGMHEGPVYY